MKPNLPEWQIRAAASKRGKKRPAQAEVMKKLHQEGKLRQTAEQRAPALAKLHAQTRRNHPRGMLGKHHSPETRARLSEQRRGKKKNLTAYGRQALSDRASRMMQARLAAKGHVYSRSTQGWFRIEGEDYYFRSSWEVIYARYLQWLRARGDIYHWAYEVDTFWFEAIRRGVRSYTPDFKVTEKTGAIVYHEVKGWLDPKSKTKIARMARYHPDVKLIVIRKEELAAVKKWERLFPEALPVNKPE